MAAIVTKALEAGLDSAGDDSEAVLARDSNAAPSVLWPEQRWLGELLSTEHDGAEYDVVSGAQQWLMTPTYSTSGRVPRTRCATRCRRGASGWACIWRSRSPAPLRRVPVWPSPTA